MNKVFIYGTLLGPPQLTYTKNGKAMAVLMVETVTGFGDKRKVKQVDVTVWEKKADSCSRYLDKGSRVLIEGSVNTFSGDYEGKPYRKTGITGTNVDFLDMKQSSTPPPPPPQPVDDGVPF